MPTFDPRAATGPTCLRKRRVILCGSMTPGIPLLSATSRSSPLLSMSTSPWLHWRSRSLRHLPVPVALLTTLILSILSRSKAHCSLTLQNGKDTLGPRPVVATFLVLRFLYRMLPRAFFPVFQSPPEISERSAPHRLLRMVVPLRSLSLPLWPTGFAIRSTSTCRWLLLRHCFSFAPMLLLRTQMTQRSTALSL